MTDNAKTHEECVKKLDSLIKDIKVAMLTTVDSHGHLRSRPMVTQDRPFDGTLSFFTKNHGQKIDEIKQEQQVNLSYASATKHDYVSVSGIATLSYDREEIKRLWSPVYKAWFPDGVDDPELALLKVKVVHAEYWDSPSGAVSMISGFVKSMISGDNYTPGDHQKVDM